MSGKTLGHQVKSEEILVYTLEATFSTQFWWNLVRIFVLTISRLSLNIGHVDNFIDNNIVCMGGLNYALIIETYTALI